MKKAVIYARYSSERQTEQSIEGQLRECYDYARYHDIEIVDTYIDRAMSGTNDNRTEFQRMLKDAKKKVWEVVLVYKLDRFSRNKYEMAIHKKALKDCGVHLISAKEHIPEGPEGIILESLLEGMAEYYSVELAQKVKRGMKESRIKGNYSGGGIPYGYDVIDKKFVVNEEKANIVNRIFEMYVSGNLAKDIVTTLTKNGIFYKEGKPFTDKQIYRILRNERYTGIYTHKTEGVYTNIFPRIIPQYLYETVQQILANNKYGRNCVDTVYLLKNKLTCGLCKNHISSASGTSANGSVVRYYTCALKQKNTKNCSQKAIRKEKLEKIIIDNTIDILLRHNFIDFLIDPIYKAHENRINDISSLKILRCEYYTTKNALNNMISAIEQGIITDKTKQRMKELENHLTTIENNLLKESKTIKYQVDKTIISKFFIKALRKEPAYLIKHFIKNITIYPSYINMTLNFSNTNQLSLVDIENNVYATTSLDISNMDKDALEVFCVIMEPIISELAEKSLKRKEYRKNK